jgi:glutamate-1-semialdehyde 2,1-aminomutase
MSERSGYEVLADVGDRVVSTFNDAARSEGIAGCVQAVQVLGGSMFDLTFADELLGQAGRRQALARVMADEGVLLLQGHPSFVCLDQADLDWDRLGRAFARALRSWTSGGEGMSLRTEGNER